MDEPLEAPGPTCSLRIDTLVLRGFRAPVDRYAVAAAMERELARLLGEADAQAALASLPRRDASGLHAGSFSVARDATPESVGVEAARAVWRSLGTPGRAGARADQQSRAGAPPASRVAP